MRARVGCEAVVADVRQQLALADGKRFEVAVFVTGSPETGNEPVVIVDQKTGPHVRKSFEGRDSSAKVAEAFLHELGEVCASALPAPTETTPLVPALQRSVQSLRARKQLLVNQGFAPHPALTIMSDLRADDRAVACHVEGRRRHCPDLPHIDTTDIEIDVCGVSVHGGGHPIDAERQLAVWREVLGKPDLEFLASCAQEDIL